VPQIIGLGNGILIHSLRRKRWTRGRKRGRRRRKRKRTEMGVMEEEEEVVVVGETGMVQVEVDVDGKVYQKSGWLLVCESMLRAQYERYVLCTVEVVDG